MREKLQKESVFKMFISGRKNCHLKGLNSYVIRDRLSRKEGMIRVFHNIENCLPSLVKDGKFCLAPHNHRQDITLSMLTGSAYNVNFTYDNRAPEKHFWEWSFYSQIVDGEIAAHFHGTGDLRVSDVTPIKSGIFLPSSQIHTVVAEPGSAWLVREGLTSPEKQENLCYSRHVDFKLSQDELYSELSHEELRYAWSLLWVSLMPVMKEVSNAPSLVSVNA